MGVADDNDLQQILASDQGKDWLTRLTQSFFNRSAKEQVLQEIRLGLAAMLPDPPRASQARLEARLIETLCRLASRDAQAPDEGPTAQPSLTGAALEDRIIASFPYPIATAYRAMIEQESAAAGFTCLLDVFESLIHYLATVSLAAYFRSGLPHADWNRELLARFLRGQWSLGDLFSLFRDTTRQANVDKHLLYADLKPFLYKPDGTPSASLRVLESFVALRNRSLAHAGGRDEAFFADIFPANRARLDQELGRMLWLDGCQLLRPTEIDDAGTVTKADVLMGERRRKGREIHLPLAPGDLDSQTGFLSPGKPLLLLHPAGGYLPLFPLSLFHVQLRAQGVYFLQRSQWRQTASGPQLRKAYYVAYESGLNEHQEHPGEPAARALEQKVRLLEERLGPGAAPPEPADPAPEDPDCELAEVGQEQAFHLRAFAGRASDLDHLQGWIERHPAGGYLLLLGPPGQGKSALAAELARRLAERGGCLLHMVRSHRNPLRFLPSLLRQAARLTQARLGFKAYEGEVEDLRNALVRQLQVLTEGPGRAVMIIDGLDELEATERRLEFLPKSLPAGVCVLLTCRPDIPLVQALRARLLEMEEWRLPALSEADLPAMLARRLGSDVVQALTGRMDWHGLFVRLQGHPLFLRRALDQLAAQLEHADQDARPQLALDLDALPRTLEAFFQEIYDEIGERRGTRFLSAEGRVKARLLQFLSLARGPLGLEELTGLLAADGNVLSLEDCRDRVLEMSQYLLDMGDERFKPWHQGLVDHVRERILGVQGCQQIETAFCRWLESSGPAAGGYGLRHHPRHLLAAEQFARLHALLTDLTYVEARCRAGDTFGLVEDYHVVLAAWPGHQRYDPFGPPLEAAPSWLRACTEAVVQGAEDPHPLEGAGPARAALLARLATARAIDAVPAATAEPSATFLPSGSVTSRSIARREMDHGATSALGDRPPQPADEVAAFGAFVASHAHFLQEHPEQAIPHARNCSALGPLADPAAQMAEGLRRPWIARERRPAVDPSRPVKLRTLVGHAQPPTRVALSADGRRAVSTGWDGRLLVWDVPGGRLLHSLRSAEGPRQPLAMSADGRRAVIASYEWCLLVADLLTGTSVCPELDPEVLTHRLCLSGDGRIAACAGSDGVVRIIDLDAGRCVRELSAGVGALPLVAMTPDGKLVLTLRELLRVWDGVTGVCLLALPVGSEPVKMIAVARDGRQALTVGRAGSVQLWNLLNASSRHVVRSMPSLVVGAGWFEDDQLAATVTQDGMMQVWDTQSGQCRRELPVNLTVKGFAVTRSFGIAATTGWDNCIRVWDLRGSSAPRELVGHEALVYGFAWAPDRQSLVTASADGTARVWDLATRQCRLVLRGHGNAVHGVVLAADGKRLVTGGFDGTVRVWDLETGECLHALRDNMGRIREVALAENGRLACSTDMEGRLRLWDVVEGQLLDALARPTFSNQGTVAATMTPDGRFVVAGGCEGAVCVWNIATGAVVMDLIGHGAWVSTVAITPDGRFVVSGGKDTLVRVWNVAAGSCERILQGHADEVLGVQISADGRWVVSGGDDNTVRVWDVRSGRCLAVHHAGAEVRAVTPLDGAGRLACGLLDGQVQDLVLRGFGRLSESREHGEG